MNQRMLELAKKVWPDDNVSHVNHEKFAELIVEECTLVVERNLYKNIGYNTSRKIREHFGMYEEE